MRFVLAFLVVVSCAVYTRAATLNLVLNNPDPAGTVVLSGSALPSPYQGGVNAYAGVLNWTDQNHVAVHYSTYCVDVASVINVGSPYQFDLVDLASSNLYDAKVINAMENLWAEHPVEGNVGLAVGPGINAGNAATFQAALWDIVQNHYDKQGNAVAGPTLGFSSPGGGFTSADLATAMDWSAQAYLAGTYTGPHNFAALVATDMGQSQAMFFAGVGPQFSVAVPTPASFAVGVVLLGGLAFARRGLRRMR